MELTWGCTYRSYNWHLPVRVLTSVQQQLVTSVCLGRKVFICLSGTSGLARTVESIQEGNSGTPCWCRLASLPLSRLYSSRSRKPGRRDGEKPVLPLTPWWGWGGWRAHTWLCFQALVHRAYQGDWKWQCCRSLAGLDMPLRWLCCLCACGAVPQWCCPVVMVCCGVLPGWLGLPYNAAGDWD